MHRAHRSIPTLLALTLTIASLTPAATHAQPSALQSGSLNIGGSASFNVTDDSGDDGNVTTVALLPSVLYFVQPGLAVGGQLQFQRSSRDDFSRTIYGVGPAVAYYFVQEGSVHPFVRGSVRVARISFDGPVDAESTQWGFRAAGGLLFLLTDAIGIDGELYYDRLNDNDSDQHLNNFGLAFGVSAFVF